jgi:hypothetical protein
MSGTKLCDQCGTANPVSDRFCGSCGSALKAPEAESAGEEGLYYCYKHKKETTRLTCGRCERPICTRCAIMGSAGVRCPDCARNKTPVRVSGVVHDMTSGVKRSVGGVRPIWYLWIFEIIVNLFRGFFR